MAPAFNPWSCWPALGAVGEAVHHCGNEEAEKVAHSYWQGRKKRDRKGPRSVNPSEEQAFRGLFSFHWVPCPKCLAASQLQHRVRTKYLICGSLGAFTPNHSIFLGQRKASGHHGHFEWCCPLQASCGRRQGVTHVAEGILRH